MSERDGLIHLWAPGMYDFDGGIQRYSGFLRRALLELLGAERVRTFSLHDRPSTDRGERFHGFGGASLGIRNFRFASAVTTAVARDRPRLVLSTHVHFSPVARALKTVVPFRYWAVAHGVEAWEGIKPSARWGLSCADSVISVGDVTREKVRKLAVVERTRLALLPNTADENAFIRAPRPAYLAERHGIGEGDRVILTVGRLDPSEQYKGHEQMFRALAPLGARVPGVRYVVVGDGADRGRLESIVRELGLGGRVVFAGRVPSAELVDYYNLCDLFAMPSRGEGFGIVYLEALLCGKPVVGGAGDGARDALAGGELGLLANPDSTEELARACGDLLTNDPAVRHRRLTDPTWLRNRTLELFGYSEFRKRLKELLRRGELL